MHTPTRIKQQAALLDRMATAAHVDLERSLLDARLSMDDLADMVLRCADCTRSDACHQWLATRAAPPPDFCRNGASLIALARDGCRPVDKTEITRCM